MQRDKLLGGGEGKHLTKTLVSPGVRGLSWVGGGNDDLTSTHVPVKPESQDIRA